jgi:nitrite reductase/ring-hydroxylating ferredoxin subunit
MTWREVLRPTNTLLSVKSRRSRRSVLAWCPAEGSVAIFRYDRKISAVSNVCQHQNGPLGEGKIIDGCVTCPWHGYQYPPDSGASPPPFTEKVATYRTRVVGNLVYLHPSALPPGTPVEPSQIPDESRVVNHAQRV